MSDLNWEESIAQWTDDIVQLESLLDGEETSEIQSARDQLVDIRIGLEKMSDVDGVSRDIAMSLESYLPDDINFKTFTRLPTHTNYDQTVISLEEKNWGLIAMIGIAIAGLITKIIMWLFDRKGGGGKDHSKAVEQNDKVVESAKDLTQKVDKPTRADVEKTINDKYNTKWNAYTEMCCVSPTEQVKAFFALEDDLYQGGMSLLVLLKDYLKIVDDTDTQAGAFGFSRLDQRIDKLVAGMASKLSLRGDVLDEVFTNFQTELNSLKNQPPRNAFNVERFIAAEGIAKYVNDKRSLDLDSTSSRDMKKRLESLQTTAKNLTEKFKKQQDTKQDTGSLNRAQEQAMINISTQIRGVIKYIAVREELVKTNKSFYKANEEYEKELKQL